MTLDLLHFPCGQSPEVFKNFFGMRSLGRMYKCLFFTSQMSTSVYLSRVWTLVRGHLYL